MILYTATLFDPESCFSLEALYLMEKEKIPVLSELMHNSKIRSSICTQQVDQDSKYKWPTVFEFSIHEPNWKTLCTILQLNRKEDLVKKINSYLTKKKGM